MAQIAALQSGCTPAVRPTIMLISPAHLETSKLLETSLGCRNTDLIKSGSDAENQTNSIFIKNVHRPATWLTARLVQVCTF